MGRKSGSGGSEARSRARRECPPAVVVSTTTSVNGSGSCAQTHRLKASGKRSTTSRRSVASKPCNCSDRGLAPRSGPATARLGVCASGGGRRSAASQAGGGLRDCRENACCQTSIVEDVPMHCSKCPLPPDGNGRYEERGSLADRDEEADGRGQSRHNRQRRSERDGEGGRRGSARRGSEREGEGGRRGSERDGEGGRRGSARRGSERDGEGGRRGSARRRQRERSGSAGRERSSARSSARSRDDKKRRGGNQCCGGGRSSSGSASEERAEAYAAIGQALADIQCAMGGLQAQLQETHTAVISVRGKVAKQHGRLRGLEERLQEAECKLASCAKPNPLPEEQRHTSVRRSRARSPRQRPRPTSRSQVQARTQATCLGAAQKAGGGRKIPARMQYLLRNSSFMHPPLSPSRSASTSASDCASDAPPPAARRSVVLPAESDMAGPGPSWLWSAPPACPSDGPPDGPPDDADSFLSAAAPFADADSFSFNAAAPGRRGARAPQDAGRALLRAALAGHASAVLRALDAGADVNCTRGSRWTPLHRAAWGAHACVLALLLRRGADVHARTRYGFTALHVAAYTDASGVCALLLMHAGADPDARNQLGWTPLHYAAESGNAEAAKVLLAAGADARARSHSGTTPLDAARDARVRQLLAPRDD